MSTGKHQEEHIYHRSRFVVYVFFSYNIQYILDTVYMRHLVDYLSIYSYSKCIRDY